MSVQSLVRLVRLLRHHAGLLQSPLHSRQLYQTSVYAERHYSSTPVLSKDHKFLATPTVPTAQRLSLLDEEGRDLGVMTRRRAEALAEQGHLRLVLVSRGRGDTEPQYQLMGGRQLMEERKRVRMITKSLRPKQPKTVRLASRIAAHDLQVKQRQIVEWLQSEHNVVVSIMKQPGQDQKSVSELFQKVTGCVKDLATVKQSKSTDRELQLQLKRIITERTEDTQTDNTQTKPLTINELKTLNESQTQGNRDPQD